MAKSLQEKAQKAKIFYYYERNICKGSLEIFLFMQITDFLADLRCILAVFKYKYLKIAAT